VTCLWYAFNHGRASRAQDLESDDPQQPARFGKSKLSLLLKEAFAPHSTARWLFQARVCGG
jgi:hypothetical protein